MQNIFWSKLMLDRVSDEDNSDLVRWHGLNPPVVEVMSEFAIARFEE